MMWIKVCGVMNLRDALLCVKQEVDVVGFVVEYPVTVPWNIAAMEAKSLIATVSHSVKTCIVTGGSVEKILGLAKEIKPDYIQLHYNETLDDVRIISKELAKYGIKTIKALRIDKAGTCAFEISNPLDAVRELEKTDISAILVDSYTEHMPGGTGDMIDLELYKELKEVAGLPLILAGGIKPDNISDIIDQANPYAIDVLTGVEDSPGCKSEGKIARLIESKRYEH
jgi:phosphoribosylanthranilate isomerase